MSCYDIITYQISLCRVLDVSVLESTFSSETLAIKAKRFLELLHQQLNITVFDFYLTLTKGNKALHDINISTTL
jgi:hypothetical protein